MKKNFLKSAFIVLTIFALFFTSCKNPASDAGGGSGGTTTTPYTELPAGIGGTACTTATYIEFGRWPQTIKSDSVTVDKNTAEQKTVGMFTYYKGSDGEWYCEALENAFGSGNEYTYSNGTPVKQAGESSYQWFMVEPIKWRVLTDNYSGKKLIFCESGIYAGVPYYDNTTERTIDTKTVFPNNYEHSKIRAWLNGTTYNLSGSDTDTHKDKGFLQTAFTDEERTKIADTTVDNSKESTNPASNASLWNNGENTYACGNTTDKIFLLSEKEVTTSAYGFAEYNVYVGDSNGTTTSTRIRKQTDFALANYAWKSSNATYGGWFFLRSPIYGHSSLARDVSAAGYADYNDYVSLTRGVVAPALCIAP